MEKPGWRDVDAFSQGLDNEEDDEEAASSWSSPGMFLLFPSQRRINCHALSYLTELGTLFSLGPPNQDKHFPLPGMK